MKNILKNAFAAVNRGMLTKPDLNDSLTLGTFAMATGNPVQAVVGLLTTAATLGYAHKLGA